LAAAGLAGCISGECVGPGCEDVYAAGMVGVFQGRSGGLASIIDPLVDVDLPLQGGTALGADWSASLADGVLALGMPEANEVMIFSYRGLRRLRSDIAGVSLEDSPHFSKNILDEEDTDFGRSLLSFDVDGDSLRDLFIGAPAALGRDDAPEAGRIYYFRAVPFGDSQAQDANLAILADAPYDQAATLLTRCGDLDGDGNDEVAVSTAWDESGGVDLAGSVTIMLSSELNQLATDESGTQALLQTLGPTFSASQVGAAAGAAVDCSHDLLGSDGLPDLVVGAPFADQRSPSLDASGAIYFLDGQRVIEAHEEAAELALEEQADWTLYGPRAETYLGTSFALGDINGDQQADLVAGAPGGGSEHSGLVLLYTGISSLPEEATLRFIGEDGGDRFGSAVALADIDGDGLQDIIAGSPRHNPTGEDQHFSSGALYIWYGAEDFSHLHAVNSAAKANTRILRAQAYLQTGATVTTGNFNGDEYDDLLLIHRIIPTW